MKIIAYERNLGKKERKKEKKEKKNISLLGVNLKTKQKQKFIIISFKSLREIFMVFMVNIYLKHYWA